MPLVDAGLAVGADCWLSPQKIDEDGWGDGVECWKIPPHAGVEWPDEVWCVCCCGGGCCCCLGSF